MIGSSKIPIMNPFIDLVEEDTNENFIRNFFEQNSKTLYPLDGTWVKLSEQCILLQEFSRKSLNWPMIKVGRWIQNGNLYFLKSSFPFITPVEIEMEAEMISRLISNQSLILAGGAVIDMLMGKHPRDYDFFCVNKRPNIKQEEMIETSFSYSTIDPPKIQIIKRIYESPEQIIGGFDLDSSRFYMDSNLDIFCSVGALVSYLYNINPINFSCYSATFSRRINKYKKKGYLFYYYYYYFILFILCFISNLIFISDLIIYFNLSFILILILISILLFF